MDVFETDGSWLAHWKEGPPQGSPSAGVETQSVPPPNDTHRGHRQLELELAHHLGQRGGRGGMAKNGVANGGAIGTLFQVEAEAARKWYRHQRWVVALGKLGHRKWSKKKKKR